MQKNDGEASESAFRRLIVAARTDPDSDIDSDPKKIGMRDHFPQFLDPHPTL
jgi:hypothetical protein